MTGGLILTSKHGLVTPEPVWTKHNTAHAATPEMLPPRQNINGHYRPFLWDYAYAAGMVGCPDALFSVSLSTFAVWRYFSGAVISVMAC